MHEFTYHLNRENDHGTRPAATFILVFFGLGAVHVAVLTDGLTGLGQVAAVWGIAVGVAIYATADWSGANLNPPITIALAAFRGFPWRKVPKYALAQLDGEPLPDPDPANIEQREFAWMTIHEYKPDRPVTYPFKDFASLKDVESRKSDSD